MTSTDWFNLAFIVVLTGVYFQQQSQTRWLIRRLENKLNLLMQELHITIEDPITEEIKTLVVAGDDLAAIKKYRAKTGATLKDAKDFVTDLKNKTH